MNDRTEKGIYTENYSINHCIGMSAEAGFHLHDGIEIYLSISGGESFVINDKIYEIRPRDLFIIGSNDLHKTTFLDESSYERYFIYFNVDFLANFRASTISLTDFFTLSNIESINKINLSQEKNKYLVSLFEKALNSHSRVGKELLQDLYFFEIIIYIAQLGYGYENLELEYYSNEYLPVINKLFSYINHNISEELSLDILSNEINTSKSYMCKIFMKYTGTTIKKYILARRIAEAKRLLKREENITSVCRKAGFNDYSNFIRTFTNTIGMSPMKYANRFKKNTR